MSDVDTTNLASEAKTVDLTRYRWTNQSNGAWVDTESMRQELVADGVLVPVERNYEAGIEYLDSIESLMTRSEMVALLDAALGANNE